MKEKPDPLRAARLKSTPESMLDRIERLEKQNRTASPADFRLEQLTTKVDGLMDSQVKTLRRLIVLEQRHAENLVCGHTDVETAAEEKKPLRVYLMGKPVEELDDERFSKLCEKVAADIDKDWGAEINSPSHFLSRSNLRAALELGRDFFRRRKLAEETDATDEELEIAQHEHVNH